MSDQDVRGIQQVKVGETGLNILIGEALVIAIIGGGYAHSWAVGIFTLLGALVAFMLMARSEKLGSLLAVVIGIAWGVMAFLVAGAMQATTAAAWASAILLGLIGVGVHLAGFQHVRDIDKAKG